MKTRFGLLLSLMLGLTVAGPALAQSPQCNVTLSTILPNNQAVLKADCGASNMTEITWIRDVNGASAVPPIVPVVFVSVTFPATLADLNFTTLLTSGTHSYTASGFAGGTGVPGTGTAVPAGKAAVITLSQPILTVAVSPGGTVNGVPPGITACTSSGGVCAAGYDTGTSVVLTATASPGFVFSTWGGDCIGTSSNCTLSMTTLRTATATFGPVPTAGQCGNANGVATAGTPTALCTSGSATGPGAASNNTWSWTCSGVNGGSITNCSAPQIVAGACGSASGTTPLNTVPSGTVACLTGTVANPVTGTNTFTWSCNGINGGANVTTCSAPMAPTNGACGTANGTSVLTAPTGTAACSAGVIVNATNPAGTFNWTCNGLAGGIPQSCTAFQVINGACGTANGTSVATAPTGAAACSAGSVSGLTGTGPWNWNCTGLNTGGTASCSANFGTPIATCGAGEVMASGDVVWSSFNVVQLWPVPAITGSGALGRAVQFVADSSRYPRGVQLVGADENQLGYGPKDYVVSQCPHSFTPVGNKASCTAIGAGSYGGPMYLRFGPAQPGTQSYDCPLTAGGTYYVNFRDYYPAYGTVSSQFVIYNRTD